MKKRELFRIMAKSERNEIIKIGSEIEKDEVIEIVRKPEKTLIMVKMKDPVKGAPYYLGEVLASEAMVRMGENKGMAVTMGDDLEKVLSMAVIDCAINSGLSEKYRLMERLNELKVKADIKDREENLMNAESKVNFSVMED